MPLLSNGDTMGPGDLPAYLANEVGYAQWWLLHPERYNLTPSQIVDRILARGEVDSRAEARRVVRAAQANITATNRIHGATMGQSLRSACHYECPANTPIALRIRVDATDSAGNVVESRSIVINATADQSIAYVLNRAREAFNRRYRMGNRHYPYSLSINRELTVNDIDQVLLNYTQGSVWA